MSASGLTLVSKKILVLERDQPVQYCYNGTLPYLFTKCEPSKNFYCSLKAPEYGCTRNISEACTKFHLCNTPDEFFIVAGLILCLLVILILSGCLWCCCCCCCGRCCRNTCPCFAGQRRYPTTRVTPDSGWSMYQGLGREYHKPKILHSAEASAPPLEYVN